MGLFDEEFDPPPGSIMVYVMEFYENLPPPASRRPAALFLGFVSLRAILACWPGWCFGRLGPVGASVAVCPGCVARCPRRLLGSPSAE